MPTAAQRLWRLSNTGPASRHVPGRSALSPAPFPAALLPVSPRLASAGASIWLFTAHPFLCSIVNLLLFPCHRRPASAVSCDCVLLAVLLLKHRTIILTDLCERFLLPPVACFFDVSLFSLVVCFLCAPSVIVLVSSAWRHAVFRVFVFLFLFRERLPPSFPPSLPLPPCERIVKFLSVSSSRLSGVLCSLPSLTSPLFPLTAPIRVPALTGTSSTPHVSSSTLPFL